ncbi:mycothiol synthase [Cryobacterium levicorallinum]|uniref:Mycothiol acetyltransferase n=2 Tax=Cryobacterium levicorallinum TaxID=995038 RepID=A0A4R8VHK3_9MICO|nr:mycothiol synthase [Cryobacterium levicorallinum]TFD58248.1 mycothiol synthase [Cryobacterium sp. Hh38]
MCTRKTMSEFPILSALSKTDAAGLTEFHRIAAEALAFDGYAPFNEQGLFDLHSGLRTAYLVRSNDLLVGAALAGRGEIDLVITPECRRRGYGRAAWGELGALEPGEVTAWSHGDHPGARALAVELNFVAVRTLLELRKTLADTMESASVSLDGAGISAFRPGLDDAEWVDLNALVFATHPEQGAITEADLAARQAESWFSSDDFLILRDVEGRMIGYNWLKIDGAIGEIYVIGVYPDAAGHGFGRALMQAGLQRLHAAGCSTAALYVEADSAGAVHLYRSLGFTDHTVDVQYRRLAG